LAWFVVAEDPVDQVQFGAPDTLSWPPPPVEPADAKLGAPDMFYWPAPPFDPAERQRSRRARSFAAIALIAALALTVAMSGGVYLLHPWRSDPVLRPAGLTADKRGDDSIDLAWSSPPGGPLPDEYVILQDGAVVGKVPGNVTRFSDQDLAPGTKYDFRVIAYRGGLRSLSSHNLYAATEGFPLADAVFDLTTLVNEKLTSGASEITSPWTTWTDEWDLTSNCATGPCDATLTGTIQGGSFTATLKPAGGGHYAGSTSFDDIFTCGSGYMHSTLQIFLRATDARLAGRLWLASKFTGVIIWNVTPDLTGNCGGATLTVSVNGNDLGG
jgi:hypothetical protein